MLNFKALKLQLLFVTLDKRRFHERIAYHDYAISQISTGNQNNAGQTHGQARIWSKSAAWMWVAFPVVRSETDHPVCRAWGLSRWTIPTAPNHVDGLEAGR